MRDKQILSKFKSRGLSLTSEGFKSLKSLLGGTDDRNEALDQVLDEIQEMIAKQEVRSSVIDVDVMRAVVNSCTLTEQDLVLESLELIDAFKGPRLSYDDRQKTYSLETQYTADLHPPIASRARMYRERVQLVQQRLLRSGEFVMRGMGPSAASKAAAAGGAGGGAHELSTIESLLGSAGVRVLLGILTQPAEGAWHLEDLGSTIRLDLRQAQASKALFTEGAVVVLQGELSPTDSTLFVVYVIGMPPAELRDATVEAMGVQDPFGNNTRRSQWVQMKELEQEAAEAMIVVLSDVTISKPGVCDQLRAVFEGFERTDAAPLFVLMGPFLARDFLSPGGRAAAVAAFAALADTLASCPRLCDAAKFLLVPGPRDPGAAAAYPRRPLPSFLTDPLAKRVKHLSSASNPCRVRFYTQELVFFRENLLKRMQRNAVIPPQLSPVDPDVTEQLVETIMEQAHLFPLPSHVAPVYWELDHSMRLTPLPHLLVLGDRGDQYSWTHKDCNAVNPGSFQTDGSFVVYRPSSREVEFSRVG